MDKNYREIQQDIEINPSTNNTQINQLDSTFCANKRRYNQRINIQVEKVLYLKFC